MSWGSLFFWAKDLERFQVLAVDLRLEFLWDAVGVLIVLLYPLSSLAVLNGYCSNTYTQYEQNQCLNMIPTFAGL